MDLWGITWYPRPAYERSRSSCLACGANGEVVVIENKVSGYPLRVEARLDASLSRGFGWSSGCSSSRTSSCSSSCGRVCGDDGRGVLRHPLYRALPALDLRLQRRGACAGRGGSASTRTGRWAPTGIRRSRSTRYPTTPPRWSSPTQSGCRADSSSSSGGCSPSPSTSSSPSSSVAPRAGGTKGYSVARR